MTYIVTGGGGAPLYSQVNDNPASVYFASVHHFVRITISGDTLYGVVVEALCDYALRFGDTFETFDDYQLDAIHKSCDRVMGRLGTTVSKTDEGMPEAKPPPGFAREILDAMDQTMRFGLDA